ncbi:MAG: helix-turn-helix domain-containing protein [Alphaproteobacteria bacterium]|nr:helix-turn-helix domain-containing protein [Alphaproteobacteria bacterium]
MSTVSELKKRAGRRVQVRDESFGQLNSGGEDIKLLLMPPTSRNLGDMFEIARLLVRAGVSVRAAKKTVDDLAGGRTAYVEAPSVGRYDVLKKKMMSENVALHRIRRKSVDVKELRARLGISQEDFAGRFGLDVATVRNWEQGRTKPDGPAAMLLQLIDRDPEKVVELLAS